MLSKVHWAVSKGKIFISLVGGRYRKVEKLKLQMPFKVVIWVKTPKFTFFFYKLFSQKNQLLWPRNSYLSTSVLCRTELPRLSAALQTSAEEDTLIFYLKYKCFYKILTLYIIEITLEIFPFILSLENGKAPKYLWLLPVSVLT